MTDAADRKQGLLVDLQRDAEERGLQWVSVLKAAGLAKSSKSRLNHGKASYATADKVKRAIAAMSGGQAQEPAKREVEPATTGRIGPDREVTAMAALAALAPDERARVLAWAASKWGSV